MNMPPIPARTRKFIGAGILAASLLAVSTGCAAGDTKGAATAQPSTSAPSSSATAAATAKKPLNAQFVRVIDGDTIEVQPVTKGQPNGEPAVKVRMLGVTAPAASACGGATSIATLKSLFRPNEQVAVTYEPTLDQETDKDGNTLAYVIIGGGVTEDVGLRMVQQGNAAASYPEGKTVPKDFAQYIKMGKIAVDQKLGIWASCPAPTA